MTHLCNRRTLLAALSAGLFGAHADAATPVIDTHIHLYDPARPQGVPWPPKTDSLLYRTVLPETYAAMVRPLGVTGTVVVEASAWLEDNQWVLDLAQRHPMIVGLVGHLEPGKEGFRKNLARFARNPKFRGIRLSGGAIAAGVSNQKFLADLDRLADTGLMLDAIGNGPMISDLIKLSDRVAKLRIAIDHMPNEPVGWETRPEWRAALQELGARPQVYAKVSGVLMSVEGKTREHASAYRGALDQVWEIFGGNRVMYGSNWPVSDKVGSYAQVLGVMREYMASKGSAASAKFFATNARDCYGLSIG